MTSENVSEPEAIEAAVLQSWKSVDDRLVGELVGRAEAEGVQLAGGGGLLQELAKGLLEWALGGEITDHLGYDRRDLAGKNGGSSCDGARGETVFAEVGPVEMSVPRDRDGAFGP